MLNKLNSAVFGKDFGKINLKIWDTGFENIEENSMIEDYSSSSSDKTKNFKMFTRLGTIKEDLRNSK